MRNQWIMELYIAILRSFQQSEKYEMLICFYFLGVRVRERDKAEFFIVMLICFLLVKKSYCNGDLITFILRYLYLQYYDILI